MCLSISVNKEVRTYRLPIHTCIRAVIEGTVHVDVGVVLGKQWVVWIGLSDCVGDTYILLGSASPRHPDTVGDKPLFRFPDSPTIPFLV